MNDCLECYLVFLDGVLRCILPKLQNEGISRPIRDYHSGSILL